MAKYTGRNGKITINGADRHVVNWEVNMTEEQLDVSDTGNAGYVEEAAGLWHATGSFDLIYNTSAKPGAAPIITLGTVLANLVLTLDGVTTALTLTSVRINSCTLRSAVRDAITFRVEWTNRGTWSWT